MLAVQFVLEWQREGEASLQAKWPALILTAGSDWLLNGLHSTPDKGGSSKELMEAMLLHVEHNSADCDVLAYGTPTAYDDIDSQASTESDEGQPPLQSDVKILQHYQHFHTASSFFRISV